MIKIIRRERARRNAGALRMQAMLIDDCERLSSNRRYLACNENRVAGGKGEKVTHAVVTLLE
jgi:hypothetical protein